MPDVISFNDAIAATDEADRSLLIGNGFSANRFAYSNLLEHSGLAAGSPIRNLFDRLRTVDFELVIRALEDAAVVEDAYGNAARSGELTTDADAVRQALVDAVRTTHPEHREGAVFDYDPAAEFLGNFETVFSLNYDLLLYWVNLEKSLLRDGFGLGSENRGFRGPFKERAHCTMFNLHGGLHLFQRSDGEIEKRLNTGDGVIAGIATTILTQKRLPIYVAEGTWEAKMKKINSVAYLRHCYDELRSNAAALFVYGHSAADTDSHIYHAVFASKIKHVYFSVFQPDEAKLKRFDSQLAKFQKLGNDKIGYTFFDAASANVWRS